MKSLMLAILIAVMAKAAVAEEVKFARPLGLIEVDVPAGARVSREIISLGSMLFFEPRLSGSGKTSCATCHDPAFAFSDPRPVSVSDNGVKQIRNAPSLYNVGYLPVLMWDGRFLTLEAAAFDPFKANGDMGIDISQAVDFLNADRTYNELFTKAFDGPPTGERMAKALSMYQRSLVSGGTRFDEFVFWGKTQALTSKEEAGLEVFSTRAGCLNCHDVFHPMFNPLGGGTALFTDFRFHNLGVGYVAGRHGDIGRFYKTRDPADVGAFKTPSLRNVELTAPYMHDGSIATLAEVIEFYDRGGTPNDHLSPSISPLHLSQEEKDALLAFLRSLTDPNAKVGSASLPKRP
ncbi:cytochrome-c peroxidase [Sinorhizobium meliloti]|uniref:cytochrome-c peroxidase n=2 Tax=Rhizobium meliloti TaxID=382 RepID=UPI003D65DBEE